MSTLSERENGKQRRSRAEDGAEVSGRRAQFVVRMMFEHRSENVAASAPGRDAARRGAAQKIPQIH
jgi:hypothetical protein